MTRYTTKRKPSICPCGVKFYKVGIQPFHPYHSPACALKFKTGKVDDENLMRHSLQRLRDIARGTFQGFIKLRDEGQPDITTGLPFKKGEAIHAGHVFKVETHPGLMFNEDNCFAQSEYGNLNMDMDEVYNSTHENVKRRIGLIRYQTVSDLSENRFINNYKWTKEEFIEIIQQYRTKVEQLKAKRK